LSIVATCSHCTPCSPIKLESNFSFEPLCPFQVPILHNKKNPLIFVPPLLRLGYIAARFDLSEMPNRWLCCGLPDLCAAKNKATSESIFLSPHFLSQHSIDRYFHQKIEVNLLHFFSSQDRNPTSHFGFISHSGESTKKNAAATLHHLLQQRHRFLP
jgi:hypothetical protein